MAIHSLPQLVSCFVLSFLFFDVSFVVAPPVSIGADIQIVAAPSTPPSAQPTPPPAQPTPTPPPAQPTPPPAQPKPPPAQPTPLPASASMPAQTSASHTPPVPPPSASPTPAPTSAPPPFALAPADQQLLGGVASGVRSEVLGLPSKSSGCVTTECIAFYPSVDVFYWPAATRNTACLSTVKDQPSAAPSLTGMISPSIYIVYPPVTVYDLCGNTADPGLGPPTTESYAPDALQTLQANLGGDPMTQVFNYADLPCPPPGIADQLDPGAAYNPVLVPPFSIVHQIENTNATLDCNVNAIKDPPRQIVRVNSITGAMGGPPP